MRLAVWQKSPLPAGDWSGCLRGAPLAANLSA
jgi:hypothetical protein